MYNAVFVEGRWVELQEKKWLNLSFPVYICLGAALSSVCEYIHTREYNVRLVLCVPGKVNVRLFVQYKLLI